MMHRPLADGPDVLDSDTSRRNGTLIAAAGHEFEKAANAANA